MASTTNLGGAQAASYNYQPNTGYSAFEGETQQGVANTEAGASEYSAALQNALGQAQLAQKGSQFNDIYGLLSGAMSGAGSSGVGGTNSAQPTVNAGPVWNQQQVQQQENQAQATAMQGAASSNQALAAKMAGQGFGSTSPALSGQQQNAMMQALASGQQNAQNLGWQAAQGNATQELAGQTEQQNAWNNWNNADIARKQTSSNYYTGLANALAGAI